MSWRLSLTQNANALTLQHNYRHYNWIDFICSLGGLLFIVYIGLSAFIPTDTLLMDKLARRTLKVQRKSHLLPKYHILDDSLEEMITVGRDTLLNRSHLIKASCCKKFCFILQRFWCLKVACCFWECGWQSYLKNKNNSEESLTQRGIAQIERELDIEKLLRTNRQSKGLLWGLTSRKHRRLVRWQSRGVLRLDERGIPYTASSEVGDTDNSNS